MKSRRPCLSTFLLAVALGLSFTARAADWSQISTFTSADGEFFDQLGVSVAVSGNLALAGANQRDNGATNNVGGAYLFNALTGAQIRIFTPSDGGEDDDFGSAVALDGSLALIGAHGHNVGMASTQGHAYLYNVDTGVELFVLAGSDGFSGSDKFGWSVALSGTTALVGAPFTGDQNNGMAFKGSAYVYDAATGMLVRTLGASDGVGGANFGHSAAVNGNYAVVGAPFAAVGMLAQAGKAYVYDLTNGNELHKLTASDAAAVDGFGWAVAIEGNYVVVGAPNDDLLTPNVGSAYVFDRTTGNQLFKLVASDGANGSQLGGSVSISGNYAIIGAGGHANATGAAYIFDLTTGLQVQKLTAADGVAGDFFGNAVRISGENAVIGAYQKNIGANDVQGRAYVFSTEIPSTPTPTPTPEPFVDTLAPVVKIKSHVLLGKPKRSVRISGVATDNIGVADVKYRLGSSGFRRVSGKARWTFTAKLKPGRNRFQIRAKDAAQNASKTVKLTVTRKK